MLEQLELAELLEQIGEAQSTTFVIKDLEHRFVHVNRRLAQTVGLERDEIIGRNDLEIGIPERMVLGDPASGWPGFWALDDAAVAARESSTLAESDIEYAPGAHHEAHARRTPLLDRDGRVVALLVQSRDVTADVDLRRSLQAKADALATRDDEISTLDSVVARLMSCHESAALMRLIVETIIERTHADGACVMQRHELGEHMEFVVGAGVRGEVLEGAIRRPGEGLAGRAWSEHRTVFAEDANAEGSVYEWPGPTQVCALPIVVNEQVVGVIVVSSGAKAGDLGPDVPPLERIVALAAIAAANVRLVEASTAALRRTRALGEVSRMLATMEDAVEACDAVCMMLLSALDISRASGYLIDANGILSPRVAWQRDRGGARRTATIPAALAREAIPQWCVERGETAIIGRLDEDPRESPRVHAFRRELGIGSTCCLPLVQGGEPIGALLVSRARERADLDEDAIAVFRAVVDQLSTAIERRALSVALHHQAFHDDLTGLPNRHRFEQELERVLGDARDDGERGAVLFLDLDGFKDVNDSLGHAIGDRLLRSVAGRLANRLPEGDLLARMGGDEFAVIVRRVDEAGALAVARRLADSLSTVFDIDDARLKIAASVGLARYPADGASVDELLRNADTAMYQAKHGGKGRTLCFDQTLASDSRRRAQLEHELREAIERREFRLVYQPQVSCRDGEVRAVEALLRWQHPERGVVSPGEFIPIAEEAGLIGTIGAWVIDEAATQLAAWQGTPLAGLRVSVNIAAPQFQLESFSDRLLATLARHGASPAQLELEVTESIVMHDVAAVVRRLNALRTAGVRIAVDDFGTGYSSLSYLQDLPLDVLKIDRGFVTRLEDERDGHSLVNTILLLASGLGLETVAEGVETREQRETITRLGCDLIQGYYFSRPVAPEALPAVLEAVRDIVDGEATARVRAA